MAGVMIGVDPHKGSHTAVVLDEHERTLGTSRNVLILGAGRTSSATPTLSSPAAGPCPTPHLFGPPPGRVHHRNARATRAALSDRASPLTG